MIEMKSAEANRIQKIFEAANAKFGSFVSDVMGKSVYRLLEELLTAASVSEERIEQLKSRKETAQNLKTKPAKLMEAGRGCLSSAQKKQLRCISTRRVANL